MPPNRDPVWTLFRRRTFSQLAYWLRVLGFNPHDRSLSNLLYFIYFCVFWFAWLVATFAIIGSALAPYFELFPEISPPDLVILFSAFLLTVWGILTFRKVMARSPFVFSEADAYLICQTPASRQKVGLAWFLMDWFGTILPFAAGTLIFSFALTFDALSGASAFKDLPVYFAAGLRALSIVLPLQMGLQAGLYGIGSWRLRRDRVPKKFLWSRVTTILLGSGLLAALFVPGWRRIFLSPIIFPLQAAFGILAAPTNWFLRLGLVFLYLIVGMAILMVWSDRIHLGQAAQETRLESVIRQAHSVMNFELAETLQHRSKLSATHTPSQLPARGKIWILVWKNLIQTRRSLRATQIVQWGYAFSVSIGVFLLPNWRAQLISGAFWMVVLGGLITSSLRENLSNWWVLRALPFHNSAILIALLGPAWVIATLLGWLAWGIAGPLTSSDWLMAALIPFLAACAGLGSAHDILSHAKSRLLLQPSIAAEYVPKQDIQAVILILISIGLPLGLLLWSSTLKVGFVWGLLSLPIAVVITFLLFRAVLSRFHRVA